MEQPPDRPVTARPHDQQIKRRAVQRQLRGGIAVGGMRFNATEREDPVASVGNSPIDRVGPPMSGCRLPASPPPSS